MKYLYLFMSIFFISCQSIPEVNAKSCKNKANICNQKENLEDILQIEERAKNKQKYTAKKTHFSSIKEIYEKDLTIHKNRIENLEKYETIYNSKYSLPDSQHELVRIKKEKEQTKDKMRYTELKLQTIQNKINLLNETAKFSLKKD